MPLFAVLDTKSPIWPTLPNRYQAAESLMWTDVTDLRDFYDTRLGRYVKQKLRRQLRELWPDVRRDHLAAIGFPTPLLKPLAEEAQRTIAVMPPDQGAVVWPPDRPPKVVMAADNHLPLGDSVIDRLLIVHALEQTHNPAALLTEAFRVLSATGRMVVIVPHRPGLWAQLDRSPFAAERSFSLAQLRRLLREHGFNVETEHRLLHAPPLRSITAQQIGMVWDRFAARWCPHFAGVAMVEATKQVYLPIKAKLIGRRIIRLLSPTPQPAHTATYQSDTTAHDRL